MARGTAPVLQEPAHKSYTSYSRLNSKNTLLAGQLLAN